MTRDDHEDDIAVEEIERRRDVRGIAPGLRVLFVAPKPAEFEAVEASRRSFFVHVDDPELYRLGDVYDARIEHSGRNALARLEVIRKEIDPRKGVALRIAHIDPASETALREILGPLAEAADRSRPA